MLHVRCSYMRRASWIGALFFWATVFPGYVGAELQDCAADHIDEWGQVSTVIDGDTIRLSDQRNIRFIAINTPELAHDEHPAEPLAEAAKVSLSRLLPVGSRVGLRYDKERFDHHRRMLAHVFDSDGKNVSVALLRQGYAFAIAVPPNLWQQTCYFQNEESARVTNQGVWSHAYFQPKNARQLHSKQGGFVRVSGRVERIGKGERNIWLDMGKHFAVRIQRKQLQYFTTRPLETLQDKVITVRGWARFYNDKLRMTLTHPAMLENVK